MTYDEAVEAGAKRYDGEPCKNCDSTEKYVSGRNCCECVKKRRAEISAEKLAEYRNTDEAKAKHLEFIRQPEQKAKANKRGKHHYEKMKEQDPDYARRNNFKTKYGITLEDYDRMVDNQNGKCYICDKEPNKLVVDHDHTTGKVRRLLCSPCNSGIGMLQEDKDIMRKAIAYIEEHA